MEGDVLAVRVGGGEQIIVILVLGEVLDDKLSGEEDSVILMRLNVLGPFDSRVEYLEVDRASCRTSHDKQSKHVPLFP